MCIRDRNPLFLTLLLLLVGQIGMRLRGQSSSKILIVSTFILYFFSIPYVSNFFSNKLEYKIAHSTDAQLGEGSVILLMGGSVENRQGNDRDYQLGPNGDRLLRVLEISNLYPELEIWISDQDTSATYRILSSLGVPNDKIKILEIAENTKNEITVFLSALELNNYTKPIVVTSASHMARVISQLIAENIDAIPAHAAYKTFKTSKKGIQLFIPSPQALTANTIVFHETIATVLQ